MKGILLSGGRGTRLYPVTKGVSKQLLPVYDKPMVYYPLSLLMLAGIREILVITTPEDQAAYQRLLGDGSDWGIELSYIAQPEPAGIAQAFILGAEFIGDGACALVLGDNMLYGQGLAELLQNAAAKTEGATIFAYQVRDPERYGIVNLDAHGKPVSIVEKPKNPASNAAVIGLYFYDNRVVEIASELKPSARGELEITDINNHYLKIGELDVTVFGRGYAWLDAGTHESLLQASQFVQTVETRQGLKIGCVEEIAYRMGYVDREQLYRLAKTMSGTEYGDYLIKSVRR